MSGRCICVFTRNFFDSGVAPEIFGGGEYNEIIVNERSIRKRKNGERHTNLFFEPNSKVRKKGMCGPEKSLEIA